MTDPTEKHVIIYDEIQVTRSKLVELFKEFFIQIHIATSETELFYFINETGLEFDLVILNNSFENSTGFGILSRLKSLNSEIPILILTSNDNKETFLKAISEGVSDYILKPFNESLILERVLRIINSKNPHLKANIVPENNQIAFDVLNYLKGELRKAKKGNFEISLLMFKFFIPTSINSSSTDENYLYVSDLFYENLAQILWETDTIDRTDQNTFLGIFPFCGSGNIRKIYNKIIDCFDDMKKKDPKIKSFRLVLTSITYPSKDGSAEELIKSLEMSVEKEMKNVNDLIQKFK